MAFSGNLIEAHDTRQGSSWSFDVGCLGGYETGYLPDGLIAPEVGLWLLPGLRVGLLTEAVYFADQDLFRMTKSGLDLSYAFLPSSTAFQLAVFVSGDVFWNGAIVIPYTGISQTITSVTSPRADTGFDFSGGVLASLDIPLRAPFLITVEAEARYDYTGGRDVYAGTYGFANATNRISAMVAPELRFIKTPIAVAVQNRFLYWFERGYSYEVMPQLTWNAGPNLALQAGLGLPVLGGGTYRFLLDLQTHFSIASHPDTEQPVSFQIINDVGGKRLRVYFQFEGNESTLFEPQNAKYGRENAEAFGGIQGETAIYYPFEKKEIFLTAKKEAV